MRHQGRTGGDDACSDWNCTPKGLCRRAMSCWRRRWTRSTAYQGAAHLCENITADAAIVAEPTELRLVIASKGCLRWRVRCAGRAAHSSRPQLGVNAISRMARLIVGSKKKIFAVPRSTIRWSVSRL